MPPTRARLRLSRQVPLPTRHLPNRSSLPLDVSPWGQRPASRAGQETLLPKGKVQEPVPVLRDAGGHRLFFGAALAGDPDGFGIASPLGKPLEQLVGGYLCVLGDERVAGVLDGLIGA